MFDIGWTELLAVVIVAIVVIGPKDLPLALRTAGRWVARGRQLMNQFRSGIDAMAHEVEMEEMEKRWAEQNARIMKEHGDAPQMLPGATGYAQPADQAASQPSGESPAAKPAPASKPVAPKTSETEASQGKSGRKAGGEKVGPETDDGQQDLPL